MTEGGTAGMRSVSVRMTGEPKRPAGRVMEGGLGNMSFPAGMTARWREEICGVFAWNPRGDAMCASGVSSKRREFRREEVRLEESSSSLSVRGVGRVSKRGGRWGEETKGGS